MKKKNENLNLINLEANTYENKPLIFRKKSNNKSRIVPLNTIINKVGPTIHFTPAGQEWFNSVYAYNKNYNKSLPIADKNLMKLVKSYFNLYITKFLYDEEKKSIKLHTRFRRLSVKRIFVGKGDLKHTSSKVIITLYVYNYEKKKFLVEQVKEITDWVKNKPNYSFEKKNPLVRSIVKDNLFLRYKRWFSMKSYSLLYKDWSLSNKKWYSFLNKDEAFLLERFYFNKFFGRFSLTIKNQLSSLNKIIPKAKLVEDEKPLFNDDLASSFADKKPFYIFKPLYNDYVKYISNAKLAGNKKPSLDNFLSLIRNVSIESLHNLNNNNIDFNNKTLYLDNVKNYLSKFFILNKNLTKLTLNVDNIKKLKNPFLDLEFRDKKLKYRFVIFKSKLYSFDGKNGNRMKNLTFDKFLYLLQNINIENLIDLKRKDINFRDITFYIHHVNKYLSKYFFVNKNFMLHIIDSINSIEKDIDFRDKTIYLDYYRYISSGKFVDGKIPTFDEFLSLLHNISIDNLNDLKNKYKDFKNKTMYIEGLGEGSSLQSKGAQTKKDLSLYNMRNILFNYDFDKLNEHAINFKRETFIHYLKIKFITLRMLIFNQNKFRVSFLKYLTRLVSNLYNKKVVFNIVNLKKLHLNSDIFTQAISLKLKNRNNRIYRVLKNSLRRVKIPYVNRAREKYNKLDIEQLLINKVRNIRINSILVNYITNKDPLNKLLLNIFTAGSNQTTLAVSGGKINENIKIGSVNPEYKDIRSFVSSGVQDGEKQNYLNNNEYLVLNSLKHRGFAGVRLEAKGRLTRRFTASRSVFKVKWKGGLKNVDSSFKGLSTVMLRGHAKSNVQYSRVNSKNRNGAFGVKGWVGNK